MTTRTTGMLSLAALLTTLAWLGLLITGQALAGPAGSLDAALAAAMRMDALYTVTYLNAALTVLTTTALFAGLYVCVRGRHPELAAVGVLFVPVYAVLNLVVYLSQLSVVPLLISFQGQAAYGASSGVLLALALQAWPGSAAAFFNNLGYAVLGIPSIIFGLQLARRPGLLRWGGVLLALNGAACLLGMLGVLAKVSLLANGSLVGGGFYLLALAPLALGFLKDPEGFRNS